MISTGTSTAYAYINQYDGDNYGYLRLEDGGLLQTGTWFLLGPASTGSNTGLTSIFESRGTGTLTIPSGGIQTLSNGTGQAVVHFAGSAKSLPAFQLGGTNTTGQTNYLTIDGTSLTLSGALQFTSTSNNNSISVAAVTNAGTISSTGTTVSNALAQNALALKNGSTYVLNGTHAAGAPVLLMGTTNKISNTSTSNIKSPLVSATANGIQSISLSGAGPLYGSGYIGPPLVKIVRGVGDTTGVGAVARAEWDKATGKLSGITVISPGYGYTVTPTVTLVGGLRINGVGNPVGTAAVVGTVTVGTNSGGTSLEKLGTGTLQLDAVNTNLTGTLAIKAGSINFQSVAGQTGNVIPNVSSVTVDSAAYAAYLHGLTTAFSTNTTFSGAGALIIVGATGLASSGITFSDANALTGLTGGVGTATPGSGVRALSGLEVYADNGSYRNGVATINGWPTTLTYRCYAGSNVGMSGTLNSNVGGTIGTSVQFLTNLNTASALEGFYAAILNANQPSGTPLILTGSSNGGVVADAPTNTITGGFNWYLSGTNTTDINEISGIIRNTAGNIRVIKTGAGNSWRLSGNNTYSGNTRVNTGTLYLAHQNALSGSTLDWLGSSDTGTLDLTTSGITAYTFGGLQATSAPVGAHASFTIPAGINLSFGNNNQSTTFAAVLAGTSTATLTKIGTGTTWLSGNNTFQGPVVITGGGLAPQGTIAFQTSTRWPSVPSFTLSGSSNFAEYVANSVAPTYNWNLTIGAGCTFSHGNYSASGGAEVIANYTGTLSGEGTFSILGDQAVGASGNRIVSAKTNSLPANLAMYSNGASAITRTLRYRYSGATQTLATTILVGPATTTATTAFAAYLVSNDGTGPVTFSGGITKNNIATDANLEFSSLNGTLDTQDIVIGGPVTNLASNLNIIKNSNNRLTLGGTGSNTFTGTVTVNAGVLRLAKNNALGNNTGAALAFANNTILEVDGTTANITVNKAASTLTPAGTLVIKNIGGSNSLAFSAIPLPTSAASYNLVLQSDSGSLSLAGTISGASTNIGVRKIGTGSARLDSSGNPSGNNTYTGPTLVLQGNLEVSKLSLVGAASSLGNPALAQATIEMGSSGQAYNAGLIHTSTLSETTDRNITFTSTNGTTLTLGQTGSGAGAITYTSGGTIVISGSGTHTVELTGSNTAVNKLARVVANSTFASEATSLLKSGSNTWNVTAVPTYTGTTTVTGGILDFADTAGDGQNITLGSDLVVNTTSNATTVLRNGLTIASQSKDLTFLSGSTMTFMGSPVVQANIAGINQTVNFNDSGNSADVIKMQPFGGRNANIYGTATIAANCKVAMVTELITDDDNGEVLGYLNVNVNGSIRVPTGTLQRGRARYRGNVTFGAGSSIIIGGTV